MYGETVGKNNPPRLIVSRDKKQKQKIFRVNSLVIGLTEGFQLCSQNKNSLQISQISRDILAHWKTLPPIVGKQASHLQNSAKTSVYVRNRTMGMCY